MQRSISAFVHHNPSIEDEAFKTEFSYINLVPVCNMPHCTARKSFQRHKDYDSVIYCSIQLLKLTYFRMIYYEHVFIQTLQMATGHQGISQ